MLEPEGEIQSAFRSPFGTTTAINSERSVLKYSVDRSGMLLSPQELAAMKDYEAVVPPEEKDESSVRERLSFL